MLHKFLYDRTAYPWLVAIICLLIVAASNGMGNSGITVFDEALLSEFGWSVGELKIRDSINFLGATGLVLIAGVLVDRIGFKPLLLFGMATLAIVYLSYTRVETLRGLYGLHILVALTIACSGNMVAIVTAANWMPHRRGLAVGIAIAGTSVGGILLPPLGAWLNELLGWREAMRSLALIPLTLIVVVALLIRNRRASDGGTDQHQVDGVRFREAVASHQFWLIASAGAATYFAILALYSHLFLYLRSLDFPPLTASLGLSVLSFAALFGKLGAGALADIINPYRLFKLCMLTMLLGLAGIYFHSDGIWLWLAVTGLGWGSLHTLYNYVLLALFGLRSAGKINGSISMAEAAGGGIGIASAGFLFDATGDYSLAFGIMLGVMTIGVLISTMLQPLDNGQTVPATSPNDATLS